MPLEPTTEPAEEQGGGAPTWMLTYGDTVTLLLTFFVLLLTFSTPDEEGFAELAKGLMAGARFPPLAEDGEQGNRMTQEEQRLTASRLDSGGAEKPPMYSEDPIEALQRHYESLDIENLPDLKGGRVIRIPLVDLFGTEDELVPEGRKILTYVVKVLRGKRHSVVVRAQTAEKDEEGLLGIGFSMQVAGFLRAAAGGACADIGISSSIELLSGTSKPGTCEITLLEV